MTSSTHEKELLSSIASLSPALGFNSDSLDLPQNSELSILKLFLLLNQLYLILNLPRQPILNLSLLILNLKPHLLLHLQNLQITIDNVTYTVHPRNKG